MLRRLYFLFPDEVHARHAVDMLYDGAGVDARHIHAMANDEGKLQRLPTTTREQKSNAAGALERRLWNANLGLFFAALLVFVIALSASSTGWVVVSLAIMLATFVGGLLFTTRIPNTHLDNFRDALAHGEVLLMVDVPQERIHKVEHFVHHHYPEAVNGGSSWTVDAMGL